MEIHVYMDTYNPPNRFILGVHVRCCESDLGYLFAKKVIDISSAEIWFLNVDKNHDGIHIQKEREKYTLQ